MGESVFGVVKTCGRSGEAGWDWRGADEDGS